MTANSRQWPIRETERSRSCGELIAMTSTLALRVLVAATCLLFAASEDLFAEGDHTSTVGMQARIEQLVLPGSELEAKPLVDRRSPIVVRVTGAFAHGDSYRYDLAYFGLEPGEYNLADFLQRKDGSAVDDLPEIKVVIVTVLPPGQVEPNALSSEKAADLGGYRMQLVIGAAIWLVGLWVLLFGGRRKAASGTVGEGPPKSLADRLRPTVEQAIAGDIEADRLAELERMLVAFWRRRLDLESMTAAEAIIELRDHDEAGLLLRQLEQWLHRPDGGESVDVAELLKPYRNLPPDALGPAPN